tara:strand:+ start:392 stop:523 length:132 start_codon:yes stop_codon:yes gene_type:complete
MLINIAEKIGNDKLSSIKTSSRYSIIVREMATNIEYNKLKLNT